MVLYILYESASGFSLFERLELDEVALSDEQLQESVQDMSKFSKIVKLKAFQPFTSEKNALESINNISEGILDDSLRNFLETNLPKIKDKKSKFQLGITEDKLGASIQEALPISCTKGSVVNELVRGIRTHFFKFLKDLKDGDIEKAQLGLAHAYSRGKVKFNVNRVDNMIIQSINLLDTLDKDINTFAMRVREWYGWHFPELVKLVGDNITYARVVRVVGNKNSIDAAKLETLEQLLESEEKAQSIADAAKHSMGVDISEIDLANIENFANNVVRLADYRQNLFAYLQKKMKDIAPNLSTLIGEQVAARLIAHAGSLTNLAKYPASTLQILGAEKALFRSLKTRGPTPKYGLIFHSSFIGRASTANKGRISRYLANKCSIASRIDSFTDATTNVYGEKMREQVEERLSFYDTGVPPRKNADVMQEAITEARNEDGMDIVDTAPAVAVGDKRARNDEEKDKKKKKKKSEEKEEKKSKKEDKKDKKSKKSKDDASEKSKKKKK